MIFSSDQMHQRPLGPAPPNVTSCAPALTPLELTAAMEQPLMKAMVGYLAARPGVTVMGPRTWQSGRRVPVVSFTAEGRASADIAAALQVLTHAGIKSWTYMAVPKARSWHTP